MFNNQAKLAKVSKKMAEMFVETPRIFSEGPYTTTTNRVTPIYPDVRRFFSSPQHILYIAKALRLFIRINKINFDMILGGATAGIQPATALGILMKKPVGYVRKEAKAGGMGLAIEGCWQKGMQVILIDDASGHGETKKKFVKNIRQAGLKVDWVLVVFARHKAKYLEWTKKTRINYFAFADISDIVREAVKKNIITPEAGRLLEWYKKDAEGWNKNPKKWHYFLDYKKTKNRSSKTGI